VGALPVVLLCELEQRLTRRIAARVPRLARPARPAFYGLAAALASAPTAVWTFSGERVSRTAWSTYGPVVFVAAIALGTAALTVFLLTALEDVARGRVLLALGVTAGFALLAMGAVYVDSTLYVALYERLHTLLEVSAMLVLGGALAILLCLVASRWARVDRALRVIAILGLVWSFGMIALRPLRNWIDDALQHVWLEELYAGRMMRRLQIAEAFLSDPRGWRGIEMARIERLRKRYSIRTTALASIWQPASSGPEEENAKVRAGQSGLGILVYYVDTLRYDVASDPAAMPHAVDFARRGLDFRRAYSAGSDTLRALPALTGGTYDLSAVSQNDLLLVARRNRVPSVLFIAKSAYEFLAKLRPSFRFDRTVTIEDYPPEREVWGYGAETPTSAALVDETLAWLADHGNEPFLLWVFNFDQHNWRELDKHYIDEIAARHKVPEEGPLDRRYRVVARAIDAEFGRLLRGVADLKIDDRLLILFVSDHGEALGREGFWVHSVFLWEPLLRVPLVLRVPGMAPAAFDGVVSLADVAPTLAQYLDPALDLSAYHGEDLLAFIQEKKRERSRPALLSSSSKDVLVRAGLIEPKGRFKLVLSLEAALPELYDLSSPDPDAVNVADDHPKLTLDLLRRLVESPVFPRSPADFDNTRPPREP
jgi:hypothetical protein